MKKLNVKDLVWDIDLELKNFKTTDDVSPAGRIVGQPKAMKALEFGLSIHHHGYNIFVTGLSGTGRMTTLESLLKRFSEQKDIPSDICYVNNFRDQLRPSVIILPAGKGRRFEEAMKRFVKDMKETIPKIFESADYKEASKKIIRTFSDEENKVLLQFEKEVTEKGYKFVKKQIGEMIQSDILPVIDGDPVTMDFLRSLTAEGKITDKEAEKIIKGRESLLETYKRLSYDMDKKKDALKNRLLEFNQDSVMPVVDMCTSKVEKSTGECVADYLSEIRSYIKENIYELLEILSSDVPDDKLLPEFGVNLVVDNSRLKGAPVIMETSPSKENLFGTIDSTVDVQGRKFSTFENIRAGSMLRANGGYLVINAIDLFQEGMDGWAKLKRSLKNMELQIEKGRDEYFQSMFLQPDPVPINLKVIILGDEGLYYTLYSRDDEFKKIFKVLCEFNPHIDVNKDNIKEYITVIRKICDEENLLPFGEDAVKLLLNESVKITEDREKLSARFHLIADLMREASFQARQKKCDSVGKEHVELALNERRERHNMLEEQVLEQILEGSVLIDVEGEKTGQVNGLSVYDYDFYAFGKPTRITARTALGSEGIVNIEREVELSGNIHDKGMMILQGYLQGRYGKEFPISMNATVCFEQSYGSIDGDSASSAELYALLSSVSDIPIKQGYAVTGSVNQNGEIQPIGGVNHKIEGFFRVCREKGLTGEQGVIIPHQNERNLNLCNGVVEAVEKGQFHIYSVKTVDEGMEILTGMKPGEVDEPGTLHFAVHKALESYALKMKKFNE